MFSRFYSRFYSQRAGRRWASSAKFTPKEKRSAHWTLGSEANSGIPEPTTNIYQTLKAVGIISSITLAAAAIVHRDEIVPFTLRHRWAYLPPDLESALGDFIAASIAKQNRGALVDPSHPLAQHVKLVGDRLCEANGLPPHRYILVNAPEINAFCLLIRERRGRNVFVFTGLLPILENQAGLAMVLGHEMSHCLAGHGSDAMAVTIPLTFMAKLMAGEVGEYIIDLGFTLRKSRNNEYEADVMGLHLMTAACYDRQEGVRVFERMEKATDDDPEALEWGKTHPNWHHRVEMMNTILQGDSIKTQVEICAAYKQRHPPQEEQRSYRRLFSAPIIHSPNYHDYNFLKTFDFTQPLPPMSDAEFERLWSDEDPNDASATVDANANLQNNTNNTNNNRAVSRNRRDKNFSKHETEANNKSDKEGEQKPKSLRAMLTQMIKNNTF